MKLLKSNIFFPICLSFGIMILISCESSAQGRPPASPSFHKPSPDALTNGFQIGIFGSVAYNLFKGEYNGSCPCDFVKSGTGYSTPFGMTINIPFINESSFFIRFGFSSAIVKFDGARYDSLHSTPDVGSMIDDLTIRYNLLNLEVLLRLVAQEDGVRILVGPTFGFVKKKEVELIETELVSQKSFVIEKGNLTDGASTRYGILMGVEYAFIPFPHIYILPAFTLDYGLNKISLQQSIRPVFYNLSVNIAYQF